MRACIIIPARYASSRFPGKPIVPLLGKPMVLWVSELAAQSVGKQHVYIATEDDRISSVVEQAGFTALKTSPEALTGTDRLAEAAKQIDYDVYVNVQGDEPLVDPLDIKRCIELKIRHLDVVINGFCWVGPQEDPESVNIPKVVANEAGFMVYMSRKSLPGYKSKQQAPQRFMKQVCIYGLSREELADFSAFGRKSVIERSEDIEILRFLELNRRVLMFECQPGSLAVDVPEDIGPVESEMRRRGLC